MWRSGCGGVPLRGVVEIALLRAAQPKHVVLCWRSRYWPSLCLVLLFLEMGCLPCLSKSGKLQHSGR